jgi:predicted glycoside hydrolase/deacetylase ChbG (UPF0249 family)
VETFDHKRIRLCLDDWGISPGVNDGILDLVSTGQVLTVSALANLKYLTYRLEELISSGIEISFHLNFTIGTPVRGSKNRSPLCDENGHFFGLVEFLFQFYRGKIPKDAIINETMAQLKVLQGYGIAVKKLESHHNIHLAPGLLNVLTPNLTREGLESIRLISNPSAPFLPFTLSNILNRKSSLRQNWKPFFVYYLVEKHFHSPMALKSQILKNRSNLPLVIHPAAYDDFQQVEFSDSLTRRANQFMQIKKFLSPTS